MKGLKPSFLERERVALSTVDPFINAVLCAKSEGLWCIMQFELQIQALSFVLFVDLNVSNVFLCRNCRGS